MTQVVVGRARIIGADIQRIHATGNFLVEVIEGERTGKKHVLLPDEIRVDRTVGTEGVLVLRDCPTNFYIGYFLDPEPPLATPISDEELQMYIDAR